MTDTQGNQDIYVLDLASNIPTRLTLSAGIKDSPVWSHDSKRVIFSAARNGTQDLYEKNADGTGDERPLYPSDWPKQPMSVSVDGKFLLFGSQSKDTGSDLWLLSLADKKASVFVNSPNGEYGGQISPGSRWVAYHSLESTGVMLMVRPFPTNVGGDGSTGPTMWPVAADAFNPRWSRDGKRLFYQSLSGELLAIDVEEGPVFKHGPPKQLIAGLIGGGVLQPREPAQYAVHPNGDRFLIAQLPASSGPSPPFILVQNWLPRLER
jgi:Tol biopolymer transport system component